jgi:exodeoxyribonuclease VII large subunit
MWKSDAARLQFAPTDGMSVEVHGSIGIYEVSGQYQLYVDTLHPLGEGSLYQEFIRLKALLESEGLFEPSRKRSIPAFPRRIGIVTSPTGAALRDMLNTLQRRLPLASVILSPSIVQGDEAPQALVAALQNLNQFAAPDVILLARGGGSMEDLWAFNDARLVRAVVESLAPVITGVGHETDFTLVDFAADLRAPTPTAAAELASTTTMLDLHQTLNDGIQRLGEVMRGYFEREHTLLEGLLTGLRFYSPLRRLQTERQRVDEINRRGIASQGHRLELAVAQLKGLENRLAALNPLAVLQRGYAVVTKNNQVIAGRSQVQEADLLRVRVQDGDFGVRVLGDG